MNCGDAFQIYLYLENRMTDRVSLSIPKESVIGQNADSVSPAFPYGYKRIPTARIDRWMEKLRRTPGSYPVNQSVRNLRFQPGS